MEIIPNISPSVISTIAQRGQPPVEKVIDKPTIKGGIEERSFAWVTDPHLVENRVNVAKLLSQLRNQKVLFNKNTSLDLGITFYEFIVEGKSKELNAIQALIGDVAYLPIQFTLPKAWIQNSANIDIPAKPVEGNPPTRGDVFTACKKLVAAFTEKLLHTLVDDIIVTEEVEYTTFTPTLNDTFLIFRNRKIIDNFKRSFPLAELVGWQPIRTDLVTLSILSNPGSIQQPIDPEDLKIVSGIVLTRVGQQYDEYINRVSELARTYRARGYIALQLADSKQREAFVLLAKVLQVSTQIDPNSQIVGAWIDIDLGYDPESWFLNNIDRLLGDQPPIVRITGWWMDLYNQQTESLEESRAKILAAARKVFLQAATPKLLEAYSQVQVLPDSSILYPIISRDNIQTFEKEFYSLLNGWDDWKLWTVIGVSSFIDGVLRRFYLQHQMNINAILVSFDSVPVKWGAGKASSPFHVREGELRSSSSSLTVKERRYYLVVLDPNVDIIIESSPIELEEYFIESFGNITPEQLNRCGRDIDARIRLLVAGDCRSWEEMTDQMIASLEGAFTIE